MIDLNFPRLFDFYFSQSVLSACCSDQKPVQIVPIAVLMNVAGDQVFFRPAFAHIAIKYNIFYFDI